MLGGKCVRGGSVCVSVCMYDCHIAVAVRPLAPFEMAMTFVFVLNCVFCFC